MADAELPVNVIVIGQTGAGKSTVAQAFVAHHGHAGVVFEASDAIEAHTQRPKSIVAGGVKITDTPGLMDPAGREKDMENIKLIVNTVRTFGCFGHFSQSHRASIFDQL